MVKVQVVFSSPPWLILQNARFPSANPSGERTSPAFRGHVLTHAPPLACRALPRIYAFDFHCVWVEMNREGYHSCCISSTVHLGVCVEKTSRLCRLWSRQSPEYRHVVHVETHSPIGMKRIKSNVTPSPKSSQSSPFRARKAFPIMTFLTGKALNWAVTATAGSGFLLFGCKRPKPY